MNYRMEGAMGKHKPITRKSFIQLVINLFIGLVTWFWYRLSGFQTERAENLEFRHNQDIPLGISYFGKYYIYRTESSVRAFSTSCTHAGCRIGKSTGAILHCSCHGSQFDAASGNPLKGPAFKQLQEYNCQFDQSSGQWVVRLHQDEKRIKKS
ncbi:MAG: Rieske (2Fe-2S) protein [Prolixibacteraceae bacterium]